MKLIGYYESPFARRVGITLKLYDIAFEHIPFATGAHQADIERINPLGRIPALVLDDGEVLVDSNVIIDYLDERAGPERALTPLSGPQRRKVMTLVGLALGATEKYVAAYYEITKRPQSHVWQPWLDRLYEQVAAGLSELDRRIASGPRFFGERITQADVTTVAAIEAMRFDMPQLAPEGRYPKLDALVRSVAQIDAFASTRPTAT